MRRIVTPLILALIAALALWASAPAALANEEWCEDDPTVVVRTPGGNQVIVHVTNYALGREHAAALRDATVSHTVRAVPGQQATDVEITVIVPDDAYATGFPTRTVASTLPHASGTIYATDSGKSGFPMRLRFRLDVP